MRTIKKLSAMILVLAIVFSAMGVTAFASETSSPPTGNSEVRCTLTFRVGYIPSGDKPFNSDLAVKLVDVATNQEHQFLLKASEAYGAGKTFSVLANTTYDVTVSIINDDGRFKVVNADGTPITKYAATETGLPIAWSIKEKTDADTPKNTDEKPEELKGSENASDMLKAFSDNTSFIATNPKYKAFLEMWASATYKKAFLEEQGNTEDSWNAMSLYQKASYSLLYIYPKKCILGGNSELYAKDRNTFIANLDIQRSTLKNIENGDAVYDAIVAAWDWHWNNWETNRNFINPFEGTTYGQKDQVKNGDDFVLTEEEKKDIEKEVPLREELSNPSTFMNLLKNNFITILILLAVGIGLGVVIYRNRKKNMGEDD